jgi:magnesium transporter
MLRTMIVGPDGPVRVEDGDAAAQPPAEGEIRWIDLSQQDDSQLATLQQRFGFHPLTIEDCLHFDQRPKLEEYGNYLFVVVHGFFSATNDICDLQPLELHAFLGKGYLVTVHQSDIDALAKVWTRAAGDATLPRRGADYLLYLIVDATVDADFVLLDSISDALDEIEETIVTRPVASDLSRIFSLRRTLVMMRKVLSPERDVFALLAKRGHEALSEKTSLYFRDVYDHLVRIYESIDTSRDLLGNALEAHRSILAQRTNDVMKQLTILSAVFLPLTFVTGFFGQNFEAMPFKSVPLMWGVIASCAAIPLAMLAWFWYRKWF